ncbi:hypothetical protein SLS60_000111 [Paraconiothyrium brasiliense]|uniref:Uncharacterized protein n=1 Tax=Paraconiothyrium brasiliense TaxID=300254 RepID=A0ABR3S5B9_9PLEO
MYHSENIHLDLYQYYEKQLRFSGDVLHAFQGVVNSYRNHEQLSGKLAHFWGLTFFLSEQRDARSVFIEELQWCLLSRHPNLSPDSSIPERNETIFPSWSWAAMMAQDMAQKRSSLAYPMYDEYMHAFNSVRRSGDEIAIFFTHRSGRQVSLEDYMIQTDSYLSFYPWFEIDCWSIWGCVKAGIPLDQYDSVYQWDREGAGYEELHLDYRVEWARAKSSILVIFLRAWEFTGQSATEDSGKHVHESDNDSTSDDDLLDFSLAYCILAKQVDPGIYSRIGLWGVRMARSGEDWDTSKYLRKLLEVQVISSDEQWKKRRIRLI